MALASDQESLALSRAQECQPRLAADALPFGAAALAALFPEFAPSRSRAPPVAIAVWSDSAHSSRARTRAAALGLPLWSLGHGLLRAPPWADARAPVLSVTALAIEMPQASGAPAENVPGLGEGVLEKLTAAGVTTVEALADMTPEQLEAIEGIGPKTVEKISLAVNNYFASLEPGAEGGVPAEASQGEAAPEQAAAGAEGEPAAPAEAESVSNEGEPVPDEGAAQEKTE